MKFRITSNVQTFLRQHQRVEKQMRFAQAVALTKTGKIAGEDFTKSLDRVLDRPTPFTKRGVGLIKATKERQVATVFVKDVQAGYLELQETGGTRRPKKRALVLPARGRINQYGNIPRGAVKAALARADTFSGTVRGVAGIWQSGKKGVKLLYAYQPSANYRPRLRFRQTVEASVRHNYHRQYRRAHDYALRTAR